VSVSGLEQGAVALLDGIVAREDVLGVVAAKWQVKGVKFWKGQKNTPLESLGRCLKHKKVYLDSVAKVQKGVFTPLQ
jgi:hypothetical protein